MATVYVTEFNSSGRDINGGSLAAARVPPIAEQTVAIGAGSVQSAAFNSGTSFVRVHADAVCSIAFGSNPTASATTMRLAAGAVEYFSVVPGHKIAVITNA